MNKRKKKFSSKVKKPNFVLYFIIIVLLIPVMKLMFRLKIDRSGYTSPDGPFVVISNHASFMDFVVSMLSVYPHRLNAVVAQKYFFYKPLDWFLPSMGCIPKTLFAPDPHSVMGILSVIDRGDNLLLFPEGRASPGGGYMGIHKATGKLIKKLGVTVVSCHIEGAYTCMPFWRKGVRWGHQRAVLATLFTPEETQSLSIEEINSRIDLRLSGGDLPHPPDPLSVNIEKNLVQGLENLLYLCPKCKAEFTQATHGNTISCTACGNSASMDRFAKLHPSEGSIAPESVHLWYKEQALYEKSLLHEDKEALRVEVVVRRNTAPGKGIEPCGQGVISLNKSGWTYVGTLSGSEVNLFFPIESVPAVPFDPNNNFQIYNNGSILDFCPIDNLQTCVKYAVIGECAYWEFCPNIQVTPVLDMGLS
ncbi:MAG: 1-acyl-sn-glycerol-3-phosphate acyltransferase [Oscillospiraceae bacterium]|nr:1-acyl-sn-glycerol-3-phosphate acyltransferase [Oscillospiraceae bacterium]